MTQQSKPNINPNPQDMHVIEEPLPQQEEFWRPPVRFGSIPVEAEPLGWDRRQGFNKHYPRVDLPTQIVERVRLGNDEPHEPNRLIWGDNLHVMRQIPSNSIDLIYIDPPFFSGKQYNVMWGDANEMRSFNDIWEDGMPGYLIWLNARLYEMKRLLKPTGSIYVHCDWHASHYIKVEMDKIFGHENFRNEIVWRYGLGAFRSTRHYPRKHDVLLFYSKSLESTFNVQRGEPTAAMLQKYSHIDENGARYMMSYGKRYYLKGGRPVDTVWDIATIAPTSGERIGYPTQKPEALLERIIKASSNEGDVVADFFVGGGTTAAIAQRLGRRFIGCDQSRVAVAVTVERLKQQAVARELEDASVPDLTVEHWGIYEAERLSVMSATEFQEFVLRAYGASPTSKGDDDPSIHGWRNQLPVWVGGPGRDAHVTAEDVQDFANAIRDTAEYGDSNLRDGVMLAWNFAQDAQDAADYLRRRERVDVDFIRIRQVRIGEADYREHIVARSTDRADYSDFLTFVHPPTVSVVYDARGGRAVTFDAGDSAVVNYGAEIVNVQWDFDYDGQRFTATPGYSFQRGKDKKPQQRVKHNFDRTGKFRIACRVQDSHGGEGAWIGEVEVT